MTISILIKDLLIYFVSHITQFFSMHSTSLHVSPRMVNVPLFIFPFSVTSFHLLFYKLSSWQLFASTQLVAHVLRSQLTFNL